MIINSSSRMAMQLTIPFPIFSIGNLFTVSTLKSALNFMRAIPQLHNAAK
jgi:hypothetical protein